MKLEWMGEKRALLEAIIKFANVYAGVLTKKFIGKDTKLSFSQIQVIEYLLEDEECNKKMVDVAERLGVTRSCFSKNVKTLEKKGLLEKYHPEDNRKNIFIKVTDRGKAIYEDYSKNIATNIFRELLENDQEISDADMDKFIILLNSLSTKIQLNKKNEVVVSNSPFDEA